MNEEKYRQTFEQGANNVKQEDMGKVAAKADDILEVIGRVDILKKFTARAALLLRLVSDYYNGKYSNVPWKTIAMAVFALLYVLNPVDLIPDYIPVIGFVDDAFVMGLAWAAVESDVQDYAVYKCENGLADARFRDLAQQAFGDVC